MGGWGEVPGQLPSEEKCSAVRIGVLIKVKVSFRVGGGGENQTTVPEENSPSVRVIVWTRVSFGVGGNFPLWQLS